MDPGPNGPNGPPIEERCFLKCPGPENALTDRYVYIDECMFSYICSSMHIGTEKERWREREREREKQKHTERDRGYIDIHIDILYAYIYIRILCVHIHERSRTYNPILLRPSDLKLATQKLDTIQPETISRFLDEPLMHKAGGCTAEWTFVSYVHIYMYMCIYMHIYGYTLQLGCYIIDLCRSYVCIFSMSYVRYSVAVLCANVGLCNVQG